MYKAEGFSHDIRPMLELMSACTLDRILRDIRGSAKVSKSLPLTRCPECYLKNKVPINTLGAKIVKKYGPCMTPYDCLMQTPHLTPEQKEKLLSQKKQLNPFQLKVELERKLENFFSELRKTLAFSRSMKLIQKFEKRVL